MTDLHKLKGQEFLAEVRKIVKNTGSLKRCSRVHGFDYWKVYPKLHDLGYKVVPVQWDIVPIERIPLPD